MIIAVGDLLAVDDGEDRCLLLDRDHVQQVHDEIRTPMRHATTIRNSGRLGLPTWAILLAVVAGGPTSAFADEAESCLAKADLIERISCLVRVAERSGQAAPCHKADHEGVRWQCVSILAEHRKDADLCRDIPQMDDEYQGLRDVCLSDVAAGRGEPDLCTEIAADGLRDSCYLKLVQGGAPEQLCDRIRDRGLRSACTGDPTYVQ